MRLDGLNEMENELFLACIMGNGDDVERLLQEGVNVNLKYNNSGNTILMLACSYNRDSVVRVLLEHGANVNEKNDVGETALIIASGILSNNAEVIRVLLEHGANVNERTSFKMTALMRACEAQKNIVARLLIQHGADVDMTNSNNYTALKYACENRDRNMVREILDRSANISNLSQSDISYITNTLRGYPTIGIMTAIQNRDCESIDKYLNEYCNLRNVDVDFLDSSYAQINQYKNSLDEFYKAKLYVKSLRNTYEVKELGREIKELRRYVLDEGNCNKEDLREKKIRLERDKKIRESINLFENNISNIVNIKVLKPIYYVKNVLGNKELM